MRRHLDHRVDAIQSHTAGKTHAIEVQGLRDLHPERGLDVVVVASGFVLGPGGYFKEALYHQARKNRLRVIGSGKNFWSCIHVDDLAAAFAAALERAPAGAEYNVVDDRPLTLRELVDAVTGALGAKHVGTIPLFLMRLLVGGPLVTSMISSSRLRNQKVKSELGWSPRYPTAAGSVPASLAELRAREAIPTV